MEPGTIAAVALIISAISLLFAVKTYTKNRKLEFVQRRDRLFQLISDLNGRNNEVQLISARYELVAVKSAGLQLRGEHAERNTALVASIRALRENLENGMKGWDENIELLRGKIQRNPALETDAPVVERLIALAQVASDDLRKANIGFAATLHILENTKELMKSDIADTEEKIRQVNLDFVRAISEIKIVVANAGAR